MQMPQHDHQDPEQNPTKTTRRSTKPGASQRRRRLYRYGLLALALLLPVAVVSFFAVEAVGGMNRVDVENRPISDILNMADQHLLTSVTINGHTVTATDRGGQRYQAIKEDGQSVTDAFRKDGVSVSVADDQDSGWVPILLDVLFVGAALALLSLLVRRTGVGGAAAFSRARARRFQETRPLVLFKDVAGVEEAKEELSEIVAFLKDPEHFLSMGARTPRGVLLVGAPGTGKTLISRAVAGEADVSFYSISGSEFVEMFVGVGAARVRDLFKEAREHAPCIVFIDEIDAVGRQRNTASASGNDEREQTLNQLLVEMDGFDKQTNVVVIAATNRPDVLDPALLRPGRFDRQVMLDKPDIRGRLAILRVHARGKPLAPGVELTDLARQTVGFSGADLANLLNEAALLAARSQRDRVERVDLDEAVLRVLAGPERKSRLITDAEKAIIAYHEVGHAIVMRSIPGSDPVQKVTAIARGLALGITVSAPAEDRYLLRRSELLAKLAGLMGGRAAEEIVFGDITTGASQDIEQATRLARRMVCEFGMSPLGLISVKADADGSAAVSAETAAKIDHEVALLVEQAYQTALQVLRSRHEKLSLIAERLIDVETIEGAELDILLATA
ncbi:MAG TPA: ATP-dependent zinc metalloprotease FtsH [Ktedonobacteraceae bacterium]|jgi:cell division protease FtsH